MLDNTLLIPWLNDAYGMENAVIQILVNHARDAESHPAIQAKLEEHLEGSRRHIEMLRECIERIGSSPSAIKAGLGSAFGALQALTTDVVANTVLKNTLAGYAAENFEVASYRALVAAADDVNDAETARVCRLILHEEEAMADWLELQIPPLVLQAVQHKAEPDIFPATG